jgi:hypothetical protein
MSSPATSGPTEITRSTDIDAPAERVWSLVSDLPRMGELSPENTGGRWLPPATGPAVGARFRGANRQGWRRWSTAVRVTDCQPGRTFAFDVRSLGMGVAEWSYLITPTNAGCTVTETWRDRRGRAMVVIGLLASGIADRSAYTASSMEQTLAALKQRAESTG